MRIERKMNIGLFFVGEMLFVTFDRCGGHHSALSTQHSTTNNQYSRLHCTRELMNSNKIAIINVAPTALTASETEKSEGIQPKPKMCCACPETKRARDECIAQHGEDHCQEFIEAHKECLRRAGFNV
jgi:cytochrome c oxidase assembly protein subunit 17